MKKNKFFIILLCGIMLLSGCTSASSATPEPEQPAAVIEPPPPEKMVISLVGDIMVHSSEITAAYNPEIKSHDFTDFFAPVKPLLQASDLLIGNLETTLAGPKSGYTGYPLFNAPEVLAVNLKEAGFDVLTTANNHSLDRGVDGILSTIRYLDEAELLHTGTFATKEEQKKPLFTEVKGCRIAILAYTYGLNGLVLPKNTPVAVNMLDPLQIKNDIAVAKSEGAQLVLVALHFGEEYRATPTQAQIQLAQEVLQAGADVIIGHHPHVLEPVVFYNQTVEKNKLISYSLGNFVSGQIGIERNTSIILNLHFTLDPETKEAHLEMASYIPVWTHRYNVNSRPAFRVVPIEAALVSVRTGRNDHFTDSDVKKLEQAWKHALDSLESEDPRLVLYPLPIPMQELDTIQDLNGIVEQNMQS